MKKNRLAAGALAFAVSMTACGCGDQVYEMTNEEEAVIVHYSARTVSKFNKKQSEGIENVAVLKALMALKEQKALERQKEKELEQEKEQKLQEETKQGQNAQEKDKPAADGQTKEPQVTYVSLNQALQLGGIGAVYRKYELTSAYQASQSYMVRAGDGKELLVLHVNLRNHGSKAAECDILSKMPSFRLTVNGEISATADTTILLNDLGTYQGRINAGDKARTVLVFQVKKGAVKSIRSMELEVTIDGKSALVQLTG